MNLKALSKKCGLATIKLRNVFNRLDRNLKNLANYERIRKEFKRNLEETFTVFEL